MHVSVAFISMFVLLTVVVKFFVEFTKNIGNPCTWCNDFSSFILNLCNDYFLLCRFDSWALAKEKRNGNLLEWPRPRLPHKPEVRRRRAYVRNIQRTASKIDVRIQGKYWKSVTQDPPRKSWQEVKAWDTQASRLHSSSWKRPKSRIVSGHPGRRFTSTGRSWHRKTTCSNTVSDCSTQQ